MLARPQGATAEEISLALAEGPGGWERPALAAALSGIAAAESPEVTAVEPLTLADRTAVDLSARLPGGGAVRCSAQAARRPDGTWRVVWFETPSGSWPRQRAAPGEGLSSSAPPR